MEVWSNFIVLLILKSKTVLKPIKHLVYCSFTKFSFMLRLSQNLIETRQLISKSQNLIETRQLISKRLISEVMLVIRNVYQFPCLQITIQQRNTNFDFNSTPYKNQQTIVFSTKCSRLYIIFKNSRLYYMNKVLFCYNVSCQQRTSATFTLLNFPRDHT